MTTNAQALDICGCGDECSLNVFISTSGNSWIAPPRLDGFRTAHAKLGCMLRCMLPDVTVSDGMRSPFCPPSQRLHSYLALRVRERLALRLRVRLALRLRVRLALELRLRLRDTLALAGRGGGA